MKKTTLMSRVMEALRRCLHIDRIEAQQLEIQRRVEEVRNATDRAMKRLDQMAREDNDPLARFVHGARGASFRRRIRRGDKE